MTPLSVWPSKNSPDPLNAPGAGIEAHEPAPGAGEYEMSALAAPMGTSCACTKGATSARTAAAAAKTFMSGLTGK